ncbi:YjjW family glycine radical enzyme activase [Aliiroseovarius subalbicans]|uniref:YjjW family glycine radical enzyme activase n=1 Tax=Aliiroseovarius subalbicans TaxID=2925840 RepID=UPI001F56EC6B|nr:YjjW family glycine radical enzyme activase [Aliiroseovarius subalbicans]MCI2398905.1 YjjW family glycine radical enzyme activase [Aliiroseovarius subalbicans]
MSNPQATVNKLLTWSSVDGPGNRLVLFLQGCNFACAACHNPYTIGVCNDCGDCLPVCEPRALTMQGGRVKFDADLCTQCDKCTDICPISASPMVRRMSVDQVIATIRDHAHFLTGITVSGGEATMQLKFLTALFAAMGEDPALSNLTRFVDTNGHLGAKGWARLMPVMDGAMLDIKALDPALHRDLTGQELDKTLRAARLLKDAGKLFELRYLLVPGVTDKPDQITTLIDFTRSLGGQTRIRLNAFQHHGVRGHALDWPPMQRAGVEAVADRLRAADTGEVATPALYL